MPGEWVEVGGVVVLWDGSCQWLWLVCVVVGGWAGMGSAECDVWCGRGEKECEWERSVRLLPDDGPPLPPLPLPPLPLPALFAAAVFVSPPPIGAILFPLMLICSHMAV